MLSAAMPAVSHRQL